MAGYIGVAIFIGLMIWAWKQIPPEPAENVEARKRYGKVGDMPATQQVGGLEVDVLELTEPAKPTK